MSTWIERVSGAALVPSNAIASINLMPGSNPLFGLNALEYSTFGLLGEADEVLGDDYNDPRFLSPGAPRAARLGLRLSFR